MSEPIQIQKVACASCGAPIQVPDDIDRLSCTYCGAGLSVSRGEGYVATKIAAGIMEAIEGANQETQRSIKRLQLQHQLSTTELQLSEVQSEIRSLQRARKTSQVNQQLRELRRQEIHLIKRIEYLHHVLAAGTGDEELDRSAEIRYQEVISESYGSKDWTITFVLCLLLGIFGAHRFYSGHFLIGFIQFMTFGGFGVWWLIDLYLAGTGRYRDAEGFLLANPQVNFGRSCASSVIVFVAIAVAARWISTSLENRLFGLVEDPNQYGPLTWIGIVLALLVGLGLFIYQYFPAVRFWGRQK